MATSSMNNEDRTKPIQAPLWMERFPFTQDLEQGLGIRAPSLNALLPDAEGVEEQKRGEFPHLAGAFEHVPFGASNSGLFSRIPRMQRFLQEMRNALASLPGSNPEDDQHDLHETLTRAWMEFNWARYGRKVYYLDDDTFDLLAETDLPRLPGSVLKPPVPSFYFLFPPQTIRFNPSQTREVWAEGAFVNFLISERAEDSSDPVLVIHCTLTSADPTAEAGYYTPVAAHIGPDQMLDTIHFGYGPEDDPEHPTHAVLRSVVSLCLYLASEHPSVRPVAPVKRTDTNQIKNPAKRRKAEARNARTSQYGYLYVGTAADKQERAAIHEVRTARRAGKQLKQRVWIRGHFRNQAHGEGMRLRKLIWIRPHMKGPDMAEATEIRKLKVQEAERVKAPD